MSSYSQDKDISVDMMESPSNQDYSFVPVESPEHKNSRPKDNVPQFLLKWDDVTLQVTTKNAQTKKTEQKTILDRVSGYAKPGELLVLMGPSGAGKSSLLDCISGKNKNVQGNITLNGAPWSKKLQRASAYVQQDDLFYPTLTVREHLLFQARLRMGRNYSVKEYTDRVDTVLEELGLNKCRQTLIGGSSVRGISGGESKRLSFASEILTNPSILFVDEPTSGLDSFMAETVVWQLQQIARGGRTVIATIHQPSSELYTLFDKLYLLADGSTVYHGKASKAVPYFASIGYECPSYTNPSDYFMRQLAVVDKDTDKGGMERLEKLKSSWRNGETLRVKDSATSSHALDKTANEDDCKDTRLNPFSEMLVLAKRNMVRLVRDQMAFRVVFVQSIIVALIIGLIYLQLKIDQTGIQNFSGALFFIVVNQTFMTANPAFVTVPMEIPIIDREYGSGLYRLAAWYVAKNLSEMPMQLLVPIVYFTPLYFLIGIGHGASVYFCLLLITMLINSTAAALGLMVGCLVRRVEIVPVVGIMIILPFLIFGGLFLNSDDAPVYFIWIQYLSPIKYGFEAMMNIYWEKVDSIPCASGENCIATTGEQVLENYSMTARTVLENCLLLLALNIGFRVAGFLGLVLNLRRHN